MNSKLKKLLVTAAVLLVSGTTYIACSGCCVRAGSLVLTPDGVKAVEDIAVGDTVLSYDTERGTFVKNTVAETYAKVGLSWIEAAFADGTKLDATADHQVYDAVTGNYLPVAQVSQFKLARSGATGMSSAQGSTTRRYGAATFHDLRLAREPHNYTANGVLVHNKGGGVVGADTTMIAGTYAIVAGTSTDSDGTTVTLSSVASTVTIGTAGQVSFSFMNATDNDVNTVDPLRESGSGTLVTGTGTGPFTGTLYATGYDSDTPQNFENVTINVTSASLAGGTLTVNYTGSGSDSGGSSFTFTGSFTAM